MKSGEFFVSTSGFLLWVFGIAGGWRRPKKALEPERWADALTDIAAINCSLSDQENKNWADWVHWVWTRYYIGGG